ncbi:MAG TPA: multicopper oxidase domain-containing protein [Terracidiphilus sp.]|nr:multicopper oxidase domain-containing protein [Terracidiphilus sp.]
MHSSLPATRLWGFEGQYPGPTLEALRGERIEILWENRLPQEHLFPVDPHIHGAMPPAPSVRISPHVHGSRTSSESDGLPEKWFAPGDSRHFSYPNDQQGATLWYHDHALGITRLNVYAGLSGFFLLRNTDELTMELPAGDYEIPLLLQDRTLSKGGQLLYAPTHEDGKSLPPGVWGPEFFGELPVVNGVVAPYLEVEPRRYRLRVLNGANSRFFNLYLNQARSSADIPSLVTFQQIGTDGGFLPKPEALTRLLLGPAERADLIVDFSRLEGKSVTLSNDAPSPYPGWMALASMHEPLNQLLEFRVTLRKQAARSSVDFSLPGGFRRVDESAAVVTRDFILNERLDADGRSRGVRINDKNYDDPVTETVRLGTVEKWRFINMTDDAHPMHLHLVQFQILHRQGFDPAAMRKGSLQLAGPMRTPDEHEKGWKDTAVVSPNEIMTILIPFEGFAGRYVFHCHMLEHEDNDMMRPYVVVE